MGAPRLTPRLVEGLSKEECVVRYKAKVQKLAKHLVKTLSCFALYEDLLSVGMVGLMDAFDRYEDVHLAKFSTYAEFRIRGSMIDEIRNQSWVPRSVLIKSKKLARVHERYEKTMGRKATQHELSKELGIDNSLVPQFEQAAHVGKVLNLDDYRQFKTQDRQDFVEQTQREACVESQLDRNKLNEALMRMTSHLTQQQQRVIHYFYFEGLRNIEISERMKISESRVCQLHNSALKLLRRHKDKSLLLACLYQELAA